MTAPKSALAQVLDWIENQDDLAWDFKVPQDVYAQAVKEGLASTFSFYVCSNPDAYGPNDESPSVYAVVYPKGMDATWKGPQFIAQLLPEAIGYDECMETEWYFGKAGLTTPAQIATLMTQRGFAFDAKQQEEFYPDVLGEASSAVAAASAPSVCKAPAKGAARAPKP